MLELPVMRLSMVNADPRVVLAQEAANLAARGVLPDLLMGGAGSQRVLVAQDLEEPGLLAAAEVALADLGNMEWVGAMGTRFLVADAPGLNLLVRVRWPDGRAWLRIWPYIEGQGIDEDLGHTLEGPLDTLPGWARELFADAAQDHAAVRFRERTGEPPEEEISAVPPADHYAQLVEGRGFRAALAHAAMVCEARFMEQASATPVLVALHDGGVALWWNLGAQGPGPLWMLARMLATDPRTEALGLFGLGEDTSGERTQPMLTLVMEPREGPASMWLRRFEVDPATRSGRFVDPEGLVRSPVARLGLFAEGPDPLLSPGVPDLDGEAEE